MTMREVNAARLSGALERSDSLGGEPERSAAQEHNAWLYRPPVP